MEEICPVCHLPKSICTCNIRSKEKEQIKIRTARKKYRKYVTTISGFSQIQNGKELLKFLKKKLACGGTLKNGVIVIQGNHKDRVKDLLIQ